MPLETLLLFVPACFALNMAFGPNNLLSMTIGARYGLRAALIAAVGRLGAFVLMITVAALGMGVLLMASEIAFTVVKLIGAAYLVWLGVKIIRAKADPADNPDIGPSGRHGFIRQEFLVAIGNPKAILIFTAFFPQFVAPDNYWGSFAILGTVFLALEIVAITLYAYAGTSFAGVMRHPRGIRWINRISGGMNDVETVKNHLAEHIRLTLQEAGCLSFKVWQTDNPLIWGVEERFTDGEAFAHHQTRTRASAWWHATAAIPRSYEITGIVSG